MKTQEEQEQHPQKEQQQIESKPKIPIIGRVQLTPEQWQTLKDGNYIYLENMNRSDGKGTFSSYVFLNEDKNKAFFSKNNPDDFVKYGKYEMRIKDRILIDAGCVTKAKVKWFGGINFAHPYLWKAKSTDTDYQESFSDPRKPKIEKIEIKQNNEKVIKKNRGIRR